MKKPDFFIVGAPKSGTTAMNEYLKRHPEIFIPDSKELHYFGSDLPFLKGGIDEVDRYLDLFDKAKNEKRVGEASVWYLFSKKAAHEIKKFSPDADIIIMLRNPVDMLHSQHSQFLKNSNEDILDFEEALEAEDERKKGQRIPESVHFVEGLFYKETVKYSEQVKRYLDVFGPEHVHIIIFDDFKTDVQKVYRDTLEFLRVDPEFTTTFEVINPNSSLRSKRMHDFLQNPPKTVRWVARAVMPFKPVRNFIWKKLGRYNEKFIPRKPMNQELRRKLKEQFSNEVEQLSNLIGRDLSFWTHE